MNDTPNPTTIAPCAWEQDGDSDTWSAECGGYFTINDGTPSQNRMTFCCYCGKPIKEIAFMEEATNGN